MNAQPDFTTSNVTVDSIAAQLKRHADLLRANQKPSVLLGRIERADLDRQIATAHAVSDTLIGYTPESGRVTELTEYRFPDHAPLVIAKRYMAVCMATVEIARHYVVTPPAPCALADLYEDQALADALADRDELPHGGRLMRFARVDDMTAEILDINADDEERLGVGHHRTTFDLLTDGEGTKMILAVRPNGPRVQYFTAGPLGSADPYGVMRALDVVINHG